MKRSKRKQNIYCNSTYGVWITRINIGTSVTFIEKKKKYKNEKIKSSYKVVIVEVPSSYISTNSLPCNMTPNPDVPAFLLPEGQGF